MNLELEDRLVFIGDSITDAGRDYGQLDSLGEGYVLMIAATLIHKYPDLHLTFINRGFNGHRLSDVYYRWERDCLDLQPDVVSIFIGINDLWHYHDNGLIMTPFVWDRFYEEYRTMLASLRREFDGPLILMQPYALPHPQERYGWQKDIAKMSALIENLAQAFDGITVHLMDPLMAMGDRVTYPAVTGRDGIHPTLLGHAMIAQEWLAATGL